MNVTSTIILLRNVATVNFFCHIALLGLDFAFESTINIA
jgi:hypothetical protein